MAGLAHTGSRCFSASATAASQPPAASMSGPATSTGDRARGQPRGQRGQRLGSGAGAAADDARARWRAARDPRRPRRSSRPSGSRRTPGPRGGSMAWWMARASAAGHVLGARRLVAPLDVGLRSDGGVAVGQVGLDRDLRTDLLAGGDDQRRLVGLGVEDPAHRVADARGGVEVDVGGTAAGLREPVGHPHHHQLLQAEDVGEVVGEVGQHRQLGRAGIAEDRRHPVGAEQLEGRLHERSSSHLLVVDRGGTVCAAQSRPAPRRGPLAGLHRAVHVAGPDRRGLGAGPVDPPHGGPQRRRRTRS